MVSTSFGQKFSIRTLGQDDFQPIFDEHTRMSQEVSKRLGSVGYKPQYTPFISR